MNKNKKIVFTGGGSAGHVTPNVALIQALRDDAWTVSYLGSKAGMERDIIAPLNIPYYSIPTGKLRRYFSWQNFLDPFKILAGIVKAYYRLTRLKPNVVFSKGGFVAFPVVVAAWLKKIPVIAHESDLTPGLANKLSFPFAKKICVTFEQGKKYFANSEKVVVTGTPIRKELFLGDKQRAMSLCDFNENKPCLLFVGGGQGAGPINDTLRTCLDSLTERYNIIHLCGKGKLAPSLTNKNSYFQQEYAGDEMADFFALSDIVVSRAGANSVYEILALKKPHLFIPLSKKASRGDQILNAAYFEKLGVSRVLPEEALTKTSLLDAIAALEESSGDIKEKLSGLAIQSGSEKIVAMLKAVANVNDYISEHLSSEP